MRNKQGFTPLELAQSMAIDAIGAAFRRAKADLGETETARFALEVRRHLVNIHNRLLVRSGIMDGRFLDPDR